MSLIARQSLDRRNFHVCLTDGPERDSRLTEIDLSGLTWIDAHGIVGIATQIDAAIQAARDLRVILPAESDVSTYLSRMGLRSYMEEVGFTGPELPAVRHHDRRERLSELRRCRRDMDFDNLAGLVYQKIARPGFYPELAPIVYEAIMELGNNVLDHAQSGNGFAAAQTYRSGTPHEYMIFAVGDAGVGLRASLLNLHRPTSDQEAIALALQEGVSGTGDRARGYGLPEIINGAIELGGNTSITSGQATAQVGAWGINPDNSSHFQGTLVGCRLACQPGT